MSAVKIAVNGSAGRMGARILALALESKEFETAGSFDADDEIRLSGKGVLIDFSSAEGAALAAQAASKAGWGLVVGTTGLDSKANRVIAEASREIPIVLSSNMSVGVNLVAEVLELITSKLPNGFSIKITETHHIHKKDSPSGTALMLNKTIQEALPSRQKIEIEAIREGEVVGDHNVLFSGPAETIEIRHHARSRDIFADGALTAARFVNSAKPGLYTMRDVLKK